MTFVDVTVLCSSLFEGMVEIELPKNLACKQTKNLLNVISYRCLWRNQCNSVQIPDTLCMFMEAMCIVYISMFMFILDIYAVEHWYLVICVTLISLGALLHAETCDSKYS
jgi:hypothetical protein